MNRLLRIRQVEERAFIRLVALYLFFPTEFASFSRRMLLEQLIAFDALVSLRVVVPLCEGIAVCCNFFLFS